MSFRKFALLGLIAAWATSSQAATLVSEGFDNVGTLASSGWSTVYNGSPATTFWAQGKPNVFTSQSGAPNSYVSDSGLTTSGSVASSIDNYLITPTFSMASAFTVSFYARSTGTISGYPDSFQLLMSTNGTSSSVSSFTTLLSNVSSVGRNWSLYTYSVDAQGPSATGRIAFRYFIPNTDTAGDYIGFDTVLVSSVPEPATLALTVAGLAMVGGLRAERRKTR